MCLLPLLLLLTAPGLWGARVTVREAPRVQVSSQGVLAGREVFVTRTQRARQYLGIPFAQPPVGTLRFAPPTTSPLPTWEDVRNSTFQPACMQDQDRFEDHDKLRLESRLFPNERIEFNEDCLYLNIFSPDGNPPNEGWPVLIWFHSGDFKVGAPHIWDFSVFAVKQKVIVVTPAYRLNVFGFFTTLDGLAPGNWGLLDQVAALDWVQQQIRDFGGDPTKVVIGGHGAGAVSVGLHLVSPLSRGKFAAALQMSGGPLMTSAIKSHSRGLAGEIGDNFGCDELLLCLRKISPLILLIQTGAAADWGPVVDGLYVNNTVDAFLPASPLALFVEQRFAKVPLMAGYTDMEDALDFGKLDSTDSNDFDKESFNTLIGDSALDGVLEPEDNETCYLDKTFVRDSVSFFYNSDSNNLDGILLKQKYMYYMTEKKYGASIFNQSFYMSNFKQIFLYRFDYRMKTTGVLDLQDWMTSPQFGEIPFVFGMPYWTSISSQIIWNSADKKLADSVMGLWGNFTKFLNPTQHGRAVKWEPFNSNMPSVMILDKIFNMSDPVTINYKALLFWNDYFPKVVRIATQCCNITNHSSRIHRTYSYRLFSVYSFYTLLVIFL